MAELEVSVEYISEKSIAHIKAQGYIDTVTVSKIEKALQETMGEGVYKLVMDLSDVNFVSSAGWGVFVSELKDIRNNKGDLVLLGMSPEVYDVYELMEFSSILKSFSDLGGALENFGIKDITDTKLVDPTKGLTKENSEGSPASAAAAPQSAPASPESESVVDKAALTLEEKVRYIVTNNPGIKPKDIRVMLSTPEYGREKVGFFAMPKLLKKLGLRN